MSGAAPLHSTSTNFAQIAAAPASAKATAAGSHSLSQPSTSLNGGSSACAVTDISAPNCPEQRAPGLSIRLRRPNITKLQGTALVFIAVHRFKKKRSPTLRELARGLNLADHSQARRICDCLRSHGMLKRGNNGIELSV